MSDPARVQRALDLKAALDAGALDEAGRLELERALREDPGCRAAVADDALLDRLLHLHALGADGEDVVRGVRLRREADADGVRFVAAVRTRRARRRRRRTALVVGAMVAMAAGLAAAIVLGLGRGEERRAAAILVAAASSSIDGAAVTAGGGDLAIGSTLTTAASGSAEVRLADGSTITVAGGTRLRLDAPAPGPALWLDHGQITCDVRPQERDRPFVVASTFGRATVVGTRFDLAVADTMVLEVASGVVRLTDGAGAGRDVAAGGRGEVGTGAPSPQPPPAVPLPSAVWTPSAVWGEAIVRYEFRDGAGDRVADQSTRGAPLDLRVTRPGTVRWLPGTGLALSGMGGLASAAPAAKVADACQASGEIAVVVGITPDAATLSGTPKDYPKRIVGVTAGLDERGFVLGQGLFNDPSGLFDLRLRTMASTAKGKPSVVTVAAHAAPRRMTVAVTRDRTGRCAFLVDGEPVAVQTVADDTDARTSRSPPAETVVTAGAIGRWGAGMPLIVGAELAGDASGTRAWSGVLHVVAVFSRVPTAAKLRELHRDAMR